MNESALVQIIHRIAWHYRNGTFGYAIKRKLGLADSTYRKPKGNQYYGAIAEDYLVRRSKQDWWHIEQATMQKLLSDVPAGASVLDVPFGTGRFVPYYLKKGMDVNGVDISHEMMSAAEKALAVDFSKCAVKIGNATSLPYPSNSFDLVVSFRFLDTILSYGDAKRALAEFSRVTRARAILELCERKESSPRPRLPRDDEVMGGLLYPAELEELLASVDLIIARKSEVITDSGAWRMRAYLCDKIAD